jgi:hypothetical protein
MSCDGFFRPTCTADNASAIDQAPRNKRMTAEPGKPPSTAQPRRCDDDRLAPSRTNGQSLPSDDGDNLFAPPARHAYRGVSYDPVTNMWRARMYCSRKHVTLGRFSSVQEAAFVHDRAAYYIHGDAAQTNYGLDVARESNEREPPSSSWRVMATLDALTKEVKWRRLADENKEEVDISSTMRRNDQGICGGAWRRAHPPGTDKDSVRCRTLLPRCSDALAAREGKPGPGAIQRATPVTDLRAGIDDALLPQATKTRRASVDACTLHPDRRATVEAALEALIMIANRLV